jgi:hypothetical protein
VDRAAQNEFVNVIRGRYSTLEKSRC